MQQFWILGMGQLGQEVAKALLKNGESINIVDSQEEMLKPFKNYNASIYIVNTEIIENLAELEIDENAHVFVSMGANVGGSIVTVQNLIDLGIKKIYARVADDRHEKILKSLGIQNTIKPGRMVAQQLIYKMVNDLNALTFGNEEHLIITITNNKIDNKKLGEIKKKPKDFQIILVKTQNSAKTFIPDGETIIKIGDDLTILTLAKNSEKVKDKFRI